VVWFQYSRPRDYRPHSSTPAPYFLQYLHEGWRFFYKNGSRTQETGKWNPKSYRGGERQTNGRNKHGDSDSRTGTDIERFTAHDATCLDKSDHDLRLRESIIEIPDGQVAFAAEDGEQTNDTFSVLGRDSLRVKDSP